MLPGLASNCARFLVIDLLMRANAHVFCVAMLNVMQTSLLYGWEYLGRPLDVAALALPTSQPCLLAAVNALQTSPVVALTQPAHQQVGL